MKVEFSIIIPIAKNSSPEQLFNCLQSLKSQTLKPNEIIIIINQDAKSEIFDILKKYSNLKIYKKNLSKSEARNYGSKKSGKNTTHFIHADIDFCLNKNALQKSKELILEKKAKAIILFLSLSGDNLITRIRKLERECNKINNSFASPHIIEKRLFNKIGGFDEEVDILDDWVLQYKLRKNGTKFYTLYNIGTVQETTNFNNIIHRKFLRGQYMPLLWKKYPKSKKINTKYQINIFNKNRKLLLEKPTLSILLLFLKSFEWIFYLTGKAFPANSNLYLSTKVANDYDKIRNQDNYNQYKNFTEKHCLEILLNPKPKNALEIGAGTGRITEFLTNLGIKTLPTEASPAMIKEYKRKKNLPKPILIKGEDIEPNLGKFETVISIRVIWHIRNQTIRSKILNNASNLSTSNVVFDFANLNRYLLLYPLMQIYRIIFEKEFYKNDHFYTEKEIDLAGKDVNLYVDKKIPLEIMTNVWLNILPNKYAKKLFPLLFTLEQKLSLIIPPGRWMVKFKKINQ